MVTDLLRSIGAVIDLAGDGRGSRDKPAPWVIWKKQRCLGVFPRHLSVNLTTRKVIILPLLA